MRGEKTTYTPKSNASVRINKFPHLDLEVTSDQAESDRNRMSLQAASLAGLGNARGGGETVYRFGDIHR